MCDVLSSHRPARKQTDSGISIVCETLLPAGNAYSEVEIKLLIEENGKPQNLIVYVH